MKAGYIFILLYVPVYCWAEEWQFSNPVIVSDSAENVFHHIDASSRRAIAVSDKTIAIVWEDNRSGTPHIYAALKTISAKTFQQPIKISAKGPAYEPGITALNDGRFIIGWEADDHLWLRVLTNNALGEARKLTNNFSRQIALHATLANKLVAVWAEKRKKAYQIHFTKLEVKNQEVSAVKPLLVDNTKVDADQLYPSVYQSRSGTVVGWEDRRHGNTRIFTAYSTNDKQFTPHRLLNDFRLSRIPRFGQGTGAMRISMDGNGQSQVLASWLDKRDFEGGYDVYAALSEDGGKNFTKNELAQDMFGENTPQWHNTAAVSNDGKLVIAWDDTRDGLSNVYMSERINSVWSADMSLTETDEINETHPVICFDNKGSLHIAYIERRKAGSRIMYMQGIR